MSSLIQELRRRNVLRVGAAYLVFSWLVLQFVDVVFPMLGLDDEVLGRPILIGLLIGLPIALVLAWVFELTPDGIKKDSDIDPDAEIATGKGRFLDRAIIVVLLAAVGLLLADRFELLTPQGQQETRATDVVAKSVAVLPFVNQSTNEEDAFFADGLTETLLHMLAQSPELKVPARSSVFAYQNTRTDIREIGSSLGVETILEGSVRRAGAQIRITAQLIEAESGYTLWSKTFDRKIDDIFSVQDEIAANVTSALQVTLLGESESDLQGVGTESLVAYEKYLQGLEQKNIASYASLSLAEGLLKEAIAADPNFSAAKIDLALSYRLQAETGLITADEASRQARALLEQALDDNPSNTRALAYSVIIDWEDAISSVGPVHEDTLAALAALKSTAEKAPNVPDLYTTLATAALIAGRSDETLDWIEKGLQVDPLSPRLNLQKGRLLLQVLNRPDAAERAFEKARSAAPGWTSLDLASGDAAFARDEFTAGMRWYLRAMEKDPQDHEIPAMIGRRLFNFGLEDVAESMLERARSIAPEAPRTQALQLEKLLTNGNHERVATLASSLLMQDVEDRGGAFSLSVFAYVNAMIELGKAANVAEFFESLRPGIAQSTYPVAGGKDFSMRFGLIHALNDVGNYDRSQAIMDDLAAWADGAIPEWRRNDYMLVNISIAQGDIAQATDHAIRDLSKPLGQLSPWRVNYLYFSWTEPLLDDPRISRRIEELERLSEETAPEIAALFDERTSSL